MTNLCNTQQNLIVKTKIIIIIIRQVRIERCQELRVDVVKEENTWRN